MSKAVEYSAKSVQVNVRILDTINARPVNGLTIAAQAELRGTYRRDVEDLVTFPLVDLASPGSPWVEGGFIGLGDGYYAVCIPDNAFLSGSRGVHVSINTPAEDYLVVASYCPLQRVLEAISYTADEGLYCSYDDLYQEYGRRNILTWANLDNLPEADPDYQATVEGRMTEYITQASTDMNDLLRASMAVPLQEEMVTATINRICRIKAGGWMYEGRGVEDFDVENGVPQHRYTNKLMRADKMLNQIAEDSRRLSNDVGDTAIRVPGV